MFSAVVDERPIHQIGHGNLEGFVLPGAQKYKQSDTSDLVFVFV